MSLLHYLKVQTLAEQKLGDGSPKPFSLRYVKKNGEIKEYYSAICTSSHHEPATINVQLPNQDIRKIKCSSIIMFNNIEVFI